MADEDDRPVLPPEGKPGAPRDPDVDSAAPPEPILADVEAAERASESSAYAASEPTMAAAGADLAAADRPAEQFAPLPDATAQGRTRSLMPALLATIGLVLIVLLGLNLYLMANPPGQAAIPALQADLAATKGRLATLEKRPAVTTDLAPVQSQVKALDTAFTQLTSSVDETRAKLAALPVFDPAAAAATTNRIDALEKRVGGVATDVTEVKQAVAAIPRVDLSPIEAKLAALDTRLKPMESAYALSRTRAAPLALTAQGIILALKDGRPFPQDLAALRSLGVDDAKLAALTPVAASGAPTQAALVTGFADLRPALAEAAAPIRTGGMFDRMMASAQSVVKVRAAGASAGSDPDAIASRIAADLDTGAFAAALTEWNGLPESGKAASAAWAAKLKQRVLAEEAAQSIAASAIATLAAPQ